MEGYQKRSFRNNTRGGVDPSLLFYAVTGIAAGISYLVAYGFFVYRPFVRKLEALGARAEEEIEALGARAGKENNAGMARLGHLKTQTEHLKEDLEIYCAEHDKRILEGLNRIDNHLKHAQRILAGAT